MLPSGSSGEPSFLMRRDGAHADRLNKIDMAKAEADLKNATALVQKGPRGYPKRSCMDGLGASYVGGGLCGVPCLRD